MNLLPPTGPTPYKITWWRDHEHLGIRLVGEMTDGSKTERLITDRELFKMPHDEYRKLMAFLNRPATESPERPNAE